jgi:Asp-tRNA(Asn)/Glu-tRNA(Gln) amidotransferase A subunit family amidase
VPIAITPDGLPTAVQLLGPEDGEGALLRAARAIEVNGDAAKLSREHEMEASWPGKR